MLNRFIGILTLISLVGCTHGLSSRLESSLVKRRLKIQFASLFNQRQSPNDPNWAGDWVFRRERLELLDRALEVGGPDVFLFQELLVKNGSDSDKAILASGALGEYSWSLKESRLYQDTGEREYYGMAVGLNLGRGAILASDSLKVTPNYEVYKHVLTLKRDRIHFYNLKAFKKLESSELSELIFTMIREIKDPPCNIKNFVVASVDESNAKVISESFSSYGMQDAFEGRCNIESDCFTATPRNEVFSRIFGDIEPSRSHFIWLPPEALEISANVNLDEPGRPETAYFKRFGLSHLWPSLSYGLAMDLSFDSCEKDDLN